MAWIKRIFLFVVVNFLVVAMISLIINLFDIRPYLSHQGLNYQSLMIFCLLWGMVGAFISLCLSRVMAKWITKAKIIDLSKATLEEQFLFETVKRLTEKQGLPMPQVAIYPAKEVNAFATGPTKKRSLIAVSSGLLNRMKQEDIEAIIGHEIAHIANGDMVTMTLLQGVINAFVMFLARVLAFFVSGMGRGRNQRGGGSFMSYILFTYLFEFVFMIMGSMVICAYSRFREYRADKGGAELSSKDQMISALKSLRVLSEIKDAPTQKESPIAALKISGSRNGFLALLSTHPPIEKRIEHLQSLP